MYQVYEVSRNNALALVFETTDLNAAHDYAELVRNMGRRAAVTYVASVR